MCKNYKGYTICSYLIIGLFGAACNLNSLYGDFVFDDTEAILNNADILPTTPISDIFFHDYWGTDIRHNLSHKSYRPFTVLTFRLNYILSEGLESWAFHLFNIVLHVLISIIVLSVFKIVFGKDNDVSGFFGALLFSVHPIHTEAVCGIVGRADLLCASFFFLSFITFTRAIQDKKTNNWMWVAISIVFAAVSMFCKEQGVTILGILIVYDIFISYSKLKWRKIKSKNKLPQNLNLFLVRQSALILSALLLVLFRCYLMDFQSPPFQVLDNPASFEKDLLTRVLSYNYIFCLNLWLLLCPEWLCFDWSMGCIPIVKYMDRRVIFVLIFWLTIALIIWKIVSSNNIRTQRIILMSVSLMVMPFLPASNIFFRVGFVLAERVLYISSAGFCLLIAFGIEVLIKTFPINKSTIRFGYSLLIVVFFIRSRNRSIDWISEHSLFNSGLEVCPLNAKVHYNVAVAASNVGSVYRAISEYEEAIRLYPDYYQAHNNLANIFKNEGKLDEAERMLRKALSIHREFPAAWMNLGVVLAQKKEFKKAEECYFQALKYRKNYPDCYYNIGKLRLEENRLRDAEIAWTIAIKLKPTFTLAWNNLIILTSQTGNHSHAVILAKEALGLLPNEASIHFNMANALGKLERFSDSEQHFLKAIELKPNNPQFLTNMGVLYHRWKKYERAELYYKEALKIQPDFKTANENYNMLKNVINKHF